MQHAETKGRGGGVVLLFALNSGEAPVWFAASSRALDARSGDLSRSSFEVEKIILVEDGGVVVVPVTWVVWMASEMVGVDVWEWKWLC